MLQRLVMLGFFCDLDQSQFVAFAYKLALWSLKQECPEFKTSLGYMNHVSKSK